MCGRVVVALDSETLAAIGRARNFRNKTSYRESYNVAPGRHIPGVYKQIKHFNEKTSDGKFELEMMKWGSKNKDDIPLINARAETVALYFKSWKRCVTIIQGYYEWKVNTSQSNVVSTHPFYIHDKNKDHLLLAGIYKDNIEINEQNEQLEEKEILIITQSSNQQLEGIHARMPVFLDQDLVDEYLDKEISFDDLFDKSSKLDIQMNFYPVGNLVNKLHNYGKDNIIHRDDINYDKNRNFKVTNYFKKKPSEINNIPIKINEEENLITPEENKIIQNNNSPMSTSQKKNINSDKKIGTKNDASNKLKITSAGKRKSSTSPDAVASKSKKKITPKHQPQKNKSSMLTDFIKAFAKKI